MQRIVRCGWLVGVLLAVLPAHAGFFESGVVKHVTKNFLGMANGYRAVYVISNIPETQVMAELCRDALLLKKGDKSICTYVDLETLGSFGRKKTDLLPYDWRDGTETVVVIDRATLTEGQKTSLAPLLAECFPGVTVATTPTTVRVRAHNSGKTGEEFQVLVDLPSARWLKSTATLLWGISEARLPEKSRSSLTEEREVSSTALLSTDPDSTRAIVQALPFSDVSIFTLAELENYCTAAPTASRRLLVLNWNGDQECTAAMAARVLPSRLGEYTRDLRSDRLGVTGWQRFCRLGRAERFADGAGETWVIAAPTRPYLQTLVDEVVANAFTGGPFDLPIKDFTFLNNLAVGVYIAADEADRGKLVLQQELEEVAGRVLGVKVHSMTSTQNWGAVLADALGKDPQMDDPFHRPDAVHSINQASQSDVLLLLWAQSLSPDVRYTTAPRRTTAAFPAFTEAEPQRPEEPDPDQRKHAFGSHKYLGGSTEERRKTPEFKRDYAQWKTEALPAWEKAHADWERKRNKWDYDRAHYPVDFVFDVGEASAVRLSGYLKIIDLTATQKVLWSTDVQLAESRNRSIKSIPVRVIGEGATPATPREVGEYLNLQGWAPCYGRVGRDHLNGIGQQLLLKSLEVGVRKLSSDRILWPTDLKAWNLPSVTRTSADVPVKPIGNKTTTGGTPPSGVIDPFAAPPPIRTPPREAPPAPEKPADDGHRVPATSEPPKATDLPVSDPTPITPAPGNALPRLPAVRRGAEVFVQVSAFAMWLKAKSEYESATGYVKITDHDNIVSVKAGNPVMKVGSEKYRLTTPPLEVAGKLYIAAEVVQEGFALGLKEVAGGWAIVNGDKVQALLELK
jgi:hypothetical protein